MAFDTQITNIIYEGDGEETIFPIPFAFSGPETIIVQLWDKTDPDNPVQQPFVKDVDYTIVDTDVLLETELLITQDIFVYRETEAIRNVDYNEYRFPYVSVNVELDRLTQAVQEIKNDLTRVYKEDVYDPQGSVEELFERVDVLEETVEGLSAGVPEGGEEGSVLTKASADDRDMAWVPFGYTGFSARFNEAIDTVNLDATLRKILNLSYLGPQVSLSASGSGTVREKGTPVTAVTLTANVTKRSDNIARIQFFLGGVAIAGADYNPPSNTGTGATAHPWTGSFSDNSTFRVDVTDDGASGGPTTVSSSASFTFVYPYYHGAGAVGLSAAAVAGLTKSVITSNANLNRTFTASAGQVFYFAYPASYGALTSILDENGFETIGDWTLRTENITGLDTNAVSYRIYEFENPSAGVTTNYTFIR